MDLVIVGNGFDLNEGLDTSYKDFFNYLKISNSSLFEDLNFIYKSIFSDESSESLNVVDFEKSYLINATTKQPFYPTNCSLWSDLEKNMANPSYLFLKDYFGFEKFPIMSYSDQI